MKPTINFVNLVVTAFAALLISGCTTLVQVPDESNAASVTLIEAEAGYARVLEQHVNERGEVAFEALRRSESVV